MALRALQGPAGGTAPVGGSGALNTIPRWTGATTLGDSVITQEANARAIGVATAANPWNAALRAIDLRTNSLWNYNSGNDANAYWTVNAYLDTAGNLVYKASAAASEYRQTAGQHIWYRAAAGVAGAGCALSESARIDSSGNVGIGTAAPVGRADIAGANVDQLAWGLLSVRSNDAQGADKGGSIAFGGIYDASNTTHWAQISGRKENGTSGQYGGYLAFATRTNGAGVNTERARIDSSGNLILNAANTGATIQAAGLQQGIKLAPATAASFNTDPNVLDCYQENTWTPTVAGFGGTAPTVTTAKYTRIGRVVYCTVIIDPTGGAAFDATYGVSTITAPFAASTSAPVPMNRGATSGIGAQGGTTVYLPTSASSANSMNVSWFFVV